MSPSRPTLCVLCCLALLLAPPAFAAEKDENAPRESLSNYYGFGPMEVLKLNRSVHPPMAHDVNRDGLSDLVIVNNDKARIDLLLQKPGFEPGKTPLTAAEAAEAEDDVNSLDPKESQWRFQRESFDLNVAAGACVVADFNDDGWLDLAYTAQTGLYVVFQEPPAEGDKAGEDAKPAAGERLTAPTWARPLKIDITDALGLRNALAAGDLNGDGLADLAWMTADGAYVVHQNAPAEGEKDPGEDARFAKPVKFPSGGEKLRGLTIADLTGDGRDDLVLVTGEQERPLHVRAQSPDGQLGAEVAYEMPAPSSLEIARLRDDQRAAVLSVAAHSGRVQVSALAPDKSAEQWAVRTYPLPSDSAADKRDAAAGDFNGDGLEDLVVSAPGRSEFLLYLAEKANSLTTPKAYPGLMEMQKLLAADLDGDGRDEVVALSTKEKIIGISRFSDGRLGFPKAVKTAGDPLHMDLADVDASGTMDLIYVWRDKEADAYRLQTVLNLGRKTAKAGPALELKLLKDNPTALRAGDVDGDGRPDVLLLQPYGPMQLVRRTETGFAEVDRKDIHSGLVANATPSAVSFAPLGPDRSTALLLAQRTFARSLVFDDESGWTVVDQYQATRPGSNFVAAAVVDLPGAKGPTIAAYDAAGKRLVLLNRQEDGTFAPSHEVEVGALDVRHLLAGNFGGAAEVTLCLAGASKVTTVAVGDRRLVVRKVLSYSPDEKLGRLGRLTVGDVNADGVPEILAADFQDAHVVILAFNAKAELTEGIRFRLFEEHRQVERARYGMEKDTAGEPRGIAIADVTGDGKNDLVVLVHDRILIYPQHIPEADEAK